MRLGFLHGLRSKRPIACLTLQALLALATPARAQYVQIESFEVTPFVRPLLERDLRRAGGAAAADSGHLERRFELWSVCRCPPMISRIV